MQIIRTKNFKLATIRAGNEKSEKLALVIPGRLDSKDYAHNVSHVQCLGKLGFFAVAFDPPGIWESPGPIDLYTTTSCLQAIDDLIKLFGNRSTILMGHSRGGTVSILAASRNASVEAFVGIMPNFGPPTPPSTERMKRGFIDSYRDVPPGERKTTNQIHFQLPINYITDGQKYDIMQSLQSCHKPKLLFYGTKDEFESPTEGLAKCQAAADPKRIIRLEAEHDYRRSASTIERVNTETEKFIKDFSLI